MRNVIFPTPVLILGMVACPVLADTRDEQLQTGHLEVIGLSAKGIDADEIAQKQVNDLEDLFRDQPNMTVGGGLGIAQKIYLRGIEDTKLNVSIDGASQTGQLFQHQGRIAIDPDLLKQVEITSGAGSALDGFGALGGAVKFVTKDAEDFLREGEEIGALLKSSYQSNNKGLRNNATVYTRLGEHWAGLVSLGKTNSDAREDGNGAPIAHSETNQDVGLFKLTGHLGPGHQLRLSHERREEDGERNLLAEFINLPPWNSSGRQENSRDTSTIHYLFTPDSELIDMSITAYQTKNDIRLMDGEAVMAASIKTQGVDLRNSSEINEHELSYGIEYRKDKALNISRSASEEGRVFGAYIQDDFELNDALRLSIGARYDHYELDDADGQNFSSDDVSPNANLSYAINERLTFRAGYAQAFRGQTTKQVLSVGSDGNRADVQAEQAENKELGLEYRDHGFTAKATYFISEIDDVVSLVGPPGPFPKFYENVGQLETKGFNLFVEQTWERASVSVSYSKTVPELNGRALRDGDYGVGKTFGDSLILNANHYFPKHDIELGWRSEFVQSASATSDRRAKPSYDTHDIYLRWMALPQDQLNVDLSLNNIFNEFYYDHGTFGFDNDFNQNIGIPESGRDLRLTLSWRI